MKFVVPYFLGKKLHKVLKVDVIKRNGKKLKQEELTPEELFETRFLLKSDYKNYIINNHESG